MKPDKKTSANLSVRLKDMGVSEFKRQTFYALENLRKGNIAAKIVGSALFVLIVANATLIFLNIQYDNNVLPASFVGAFYVFSTACFCLEYLARIWIADLAFGDCTRLQARLKYIISPFGIIDLLSFAPSMISWFFPITSMLIHAIGILRLVRLVKLTRYMRGFRTIGRVMVKHYHEIVAAFLVILLLIVVSSVIMYEAEHAAQPKQFNDLFQGLWWAVETVTGTGYGDIVPITPLGKLAGGIIMLLAVGLIAIPGGIFSAGFVAEYQNANLRKIERDVKRTSDTVKKTSTETEQHLTNQVRHNDAELEHKVQENDAKENLHVKDMVDESERTEDADIERELQDAADVANDMADAQDVLHDMRQAENDRSEK